MKEATISGGALVTVLVLLIPAESYRALEQVVDARAVISPATIIFVDGRERPEYVQWTDVEQVDFDRPPAMYPPLGGR